MYGARAKLTERWYVVSGTMSRNLSIHQEHELLLALEKAGLVSDEAQAVITSKQNQLAKGMLAWLRAQLNPPVQLPAGLLTPVSEYFERFKARSELRGWDFAGHEREALYLELQRHEHAGQLLPVGLSIWLSKDLRYNWQEALAWAFDTACEVGLNPYDYVGDSPLEFCPGSEILGGRKVEAVGLDFLTFRDAEHGIIPRDVRNAHPDRRWPSLEALYFLALNPGYMKAMDGRDIPFLIAPGLVADSDDVPYFDRYGDEFGASCSWGGRRWYCTSWVAFRES